MMNTWARDESRLMGDLLDATRQSDASVVVRIPILLRKFQTSQGIKHYVRTSLVTAPLRHMRCAFPFRGQPGCLTD